MKSLLGGDSHQFHTGPKDRLLSFLRQHLDLDLAHYSDASVKRRFNKILKEFQFSNVDDLIDLLKKQPDARQLFLEKFTVNVTEMFRDPQCYRSLIEKVIPALSHKKEIRIWSAGCSTGEEVLSLCILLEEQKLLDRCRILATDLTPSVLQKAREAAYPMKLMRAYQDAYREAGGQYDLSGYYQEKNQKAHFNRYLLRNVRYVSHDLTKKPPQQGTDLIVCRNVVIYFNAHLQHQVFHNFDNHLISNGFLMIGSKESLIFYQHNQKFREIAPESRIYQKRS